MAARRRCKADIYQLESFCKEFEKIPDDELTISYLEVKHGELDRRWFKVIGTYESYLVDEESEMAENFTDDISVRYEKIGNQYQKVKAKIVERLRFAMKTDTANESHKGQSRLKI